MILKNPYDSHVHWLWTGEQKSVLSLHHLTGIHDLKNLPIKKEYFREEWLIGFGWDQNKFPSKEFPTRQDLDALFPHYPVVFTRVDGHAIWVNTVALNLAKITSETVSPEGGEILKDPHGQPTGVFIDLAYNLILTALPQPTLSDIEKYLLKGMQTFNQAGITHIRDLSCNEMQWSVEYRLDQADQLKLAIEQFFDAFNPSKFEAALDLACRARKEPRKNIRICGVKIFYDGAIGSEGALLSQPYLTRPHHFGLKILEREVLEEMLIKTWENKFEIAVHVIGDQAAEDVVTIATDLKRRGYEGRLNLEHGELLNMKTIELMKGLNVRCHIQPSHWLTDREWLVQKVGDLSRLAFPWQRLESERIHFDFGSDSPIEPPSFFRTVEAVKDASEHGIAPPVRDVLSYHQHPDSNWIENCYCELTNDQVSKTVFSGKVVFQK